MSAKALWRMVRNRAAISVRSANDEIVLTVRPLVFRLSLVYFPMPEFDYPAIARSLFRIPRVNRVSFITAI